MKHGKGKEFYRYNCLKYEGDFVKDKYEGNGKFIFGNGNYYEGPFVNGLKHGKGLLYYKQNKTFLDIIYFKDEPQHCIIF